MASTQVSWTPSVSGNRVKWTWSGWVKRSSLGEQVLFGSYQSGAYNTELKFTTSDELHFADTYNSNTNGRIITTAKFKDINAWYHIVAIFDNAAGSGASDKIKIYVNGQNQAGAYGNAPSNATTLNADGTKIQIGQLGAGSNFNGLMSHVHFCDGYAYDASYFGETDSTTGEWKIKTSPSVSYGTNGFWILKDGNSVTNQAGNSNPNFTVENGTLTKTLDNPSNVFATLNTLLKTPSGLSYSNGNTTLTTTNTQWEGSATTMGVSSGKWYWEAKYNTGSGIKLDIARLPSDMRFLDNSNNSYLGHDTNGYGYQLNNSGTDYSTTAGTTTTWNSSINGNSTKIYMVAVDLDNGKMWFGANGTWANTSGTANPATGTDPRLSFSAKLNGEHWLFGLSVEGSGGSHNANFGNGYYGTTAVTTNSGNGYSDSNSQGKFSYQPPTNFLALCTKNLNE
tara:strand:+ start:219 stop:1574 length:1356 start_codon:yes stop_codon:yes gene_type:complete